MSIQDMRKEYVRTMAINFQLFAAENNLSMDQVRRASAVFEKLAAKYGLTEEFAENGII